LKLAVIGAGTMGSGIAYASASSGHDVFVVEQDQKLLDQGMKRINDYIERGVKKGQLDKSRAEALRTSIKGTVDFAKACKNAEIVVEAVFEDPRVKEQVFIILDRTCPPRTIIASNTSSISITKLASATRRPDKVLGLHFFNPVPTMKLVELIKGDRTSEETVITASKFVQSLGKTVVQSADKTGFIVNRALMPFLNEAIKLLDEKVATPEDIDNAFLLGTNHPMGPLHLADFIGLDVVLSTLRVLETEYGSCFSPAGTLVRLVGEGKLGHKTGSGFYGY